MRNKPILIALMLSATVAIPLQAQKLNKEIALDEVTVSVKSAAREKQEQALAITVVDLKKLYQASAPLGKVLNQVSSVRIREDGGMGSNYSFNINGFSGNQVKFFLDGIPMDNFGSSFNLSTISANMAERIEVYKGVLPVSLGGDALGGAVNIVTRTNANNLDASYSIGSFNTQKITANGAHTNKNGFTIRINTFYNYSKNNYKVWAPIVDLNSNKNLGNEWVSRFHDQYNSKGLRLETGVVHQSYADYLLAGIILSNNNKDIQTGATMDAVYGGVISKSESVIPTLRFKKSDLFVDGLSLSLYGAYSRVNDCNIDTLARTYNWRNEWVPSNNGEKFYTNSKIKNREWVGNANLSYMLNQHQSVTLNQVISDKKRSMFDQVDPDNASNQIPQKLTKYITGLGWQLQYKHWNANVFGKRYASHSSTYKLENQFTNQEHLEQLSASNTYWGYGSAWSYFILPHLQAKVSYEKAYRLPESNEMFGDGFIQQRNPDLKAENSNNANAGIIYEPQFKVHHLFFETNFIYRNTKDFILKGVSITSDPTTSYENVGKVLTRGLETSAKYEWNNRLHAGAHITYQDIIDNQQYEDNSNSYVGDGVIEHITYKERLPNIPYLFGGANAGIKIKDWGYNKSELTFDYMFNYVKDYYLTFPGLGSKASKKVIPQQLSHDIALGYTMEEGKYSILLECTNLTNQLLYDNYRLQKPGRAFSITLRYFLK